MRMVSPFLKRALYPGMASLGLFRKSGIVGEFCVVTYHGVLPAGYRSDDTALDGNLVSAANLRAQLCLLRSHYHVLHPDEFLAHVRERAALPPRSVLLTCDDGLQNVVSDMLPILQEAGVSCLFFVTGASTGDGAGMLWYEELYLALRDAPAGELAVADWNLKTELRSPDQRQGVWWKWVRELSRYPSEARSKAVSAVCAQAGLGEGRRAPLDGPAARRFRLLTADGVRQLVQAGMSVGAHTTSHPVLACMPDEDAWSEIQNNQSALKAVVEREIWALAYPFGDATSAGAREFEMAARAGFECAFVNHGGGFHTKFPRFAIPRVHVTADMTLGEFEAHVSGFHEKLRQRFGRQGVVSCA